MDRSDGQDFRILFVMDSLFTGGAEYSTLRLAEYLQQQPGWNVKLVCLKKMNPEYDAAEFGLGESVIRLKGKSFLSRLRELQRIAREFSPAWIHSILLSSNLLCRILNIFYRQPRYVESLVNRTYDKSRLADKRVNPRTLSLYRKLDAFTQKWSPDAFHAVTADIASHYAESTATPREIVTVIPRGRKPNPLDGNAGLRKKVRDELGIPQEAIVFINVGRHEFQKSQVTLIKAMGSMAVSGTLNCFALIVGREGAETNAIKAAVHANKVSGRVLLLGHRTDVYELLAAADIFILCSVYEGIGGVLIEAEASGLPIISSDLAGLKEVIEVGKNALTFRPGDAGALQRAMVELAEDSAKRQSMSEQSRTLFAERFEISAIHKKMLNFYLDLLRRQSR